MSIVVAVKVLADAGTAALRLFGDDLTREDASKLLEMWAPMRRLRVDDDATADEVTHLVLGRFLPAEPPSVPGVDWAPLEWTNCHPDSDLPPCLHASDEVAADAAVLVAESTAEPTDWLQYGACPTCGVAAGQVCVFSNILNLLGEPRTTPHDHRPLVEGGAQPTAEPKAREYRDVQGDTWHELPFGMLRLFTKTHDGSQLMAPRGIVEREYGPLVEVTAQPTAEAVQP